MAIAIQPYTEDRIPAVKAFNQRLAAGRVAPEFHFPESNIPYWLPPLNGRRLFQEYYVALEGDLVRGAFILKHQDFSIVGTTEPVVYYHLPVSEGIVNKVYASVGVLMLRSAMKMRPMLFALGMGGFDRPLPTMLKAMGWSLSTVPFYFRIHHPAAFLRQIAPLRQSFAHRSLASIAAASGAGHVGIKTIQWIGTKNRGRSVQTEIVSGFGPWADQLWQQNASRYPLIADRSIAALNVLYPSGKNFVCVRVLRGAETTGWAVLLDTQMHDNKYFGNLRVGTIADAFGAPENAPEIIQSATRALEARGVDLIVANHSNSTWGEAFQSNGYFDGPSNFIFAASKPLAEKLAPLNTNLPNVYF